MDAKAWLAALGAAAGALAAPALAQTDARASGFYVGAAAGQSKYHFSCGAGCDQDTTPTSFRLLAGYQLNRHFAAELAYNDLGKARFSIPGGSATLSAEVWDLSAIVAWPLSNRFGIFGRLGAYHGKLKQSGAGSFGDAAGSADDVTWGMGAQYEATRNLGLRADWQRFAKMGGRDFGTETDTDALSFGIVWRLQ